MMPARTSPWLSLKNGKRSWKLPASSWSLAGTTLLLPGEAFTSHGPTVPMPTWFCSRAWFSHVGPFDEGGRGVPEDLLFFYEHLRKGGGVVRVDRSLLMYRYHPAAATHAVLETTIWTLRVRFLEEQALPRWATFTIWNAGRQGRRLYRSLTAESRRKVVAFCDVDENKIQKGFYCHEESQERPKPRVPVLHFRAARPPFVICVKLVSVGLGARDRACPVHQEALGWEGGSDCRYARLGGPCGGHLQPGLGARGRGGPSVLRAAGDEAAQMHLHH
uniref:UDP-GlcNAc:betaGal beta-1,3-N-acetylglucosaminyltransferase like 1 n=1 Tax=Sus scrofa TaxID=9823 RepID=A0A8D0VGX7_PIG